MKRDKIKVGGTDTNQHMFEVLRGGECKVNGWDK